MIPVILGILIALFINNWSENQKDKKFIKKVLGAISTEIEDNKETLIEIIPKHDSLIDTINFYHSDESVAIGNIIDKVQGVQAVSIKNTAWKSLLNTKIELIDFETISYLSNIEETKPIMQAQIESLMDCVYNNAEKSDETSKTYFKLLINDLVYLEKNALEEHEKLLKLISTNITKNE